MARPRHEPTEQSRRTVESMCAYGIPHDEISAVIGITAKTLRLRYKAELAAAHVKANSRVGEALFLQAVGAPARYDDQGRLLQAEQPRVVTAGIWWSKCRMGWKETNVVENVGKDGGPIESRTMIERGRSYETMTDDELRAELAARASGS